MLVLVSVLVLALVLVYYKGVFCKPLQESVSEVRSADGEVVRPGANEPVNSSERAPGKYVRSALWKDVSAAA